MRRHPSPDDAPAGPVPAGGSIPLQWKLPLLVTGFVAAGLALMLAFTYATVRQRSEASLRARLEQASRQVASTAGASIARRAAMLRETAADPAVLRVLADAREGRTSARADLRAAAAALAEAVPDGDTALPVELWDAGGRVLAVAGRPLPAAERRPPRPDAGAPDSVRIGPLHASGESVRFWVLAPAADSAGPLGWIAQARSVGGPRDATRTLGNVISEEVAMFTRNADGGFWAEAPGTPAAAPSGVDSAGGGLTYERPGTGRVVAAEAPIAGTPWLLVLETPERWVVHRARVTIRPLLAAAVLLTALAGALSWLAARRITRPLGALTAAAEAVARGRYDRPVRVGGRDEIARLAAGFDAMARQVAAARAELEHRVEDAQRARADAERARAEAELASRAKSDFLAVMSHELRTPLNAIGGYAELLEMGLHGPVTDAQREALGRIVHSQAHLLTLINDVLSFARIEAGQVRYLMDDVPLAAALAELESMVAPQVRASGLTFRLQRCDPGLAVRADRDKLRQVLLNLLGNAIKYTPSGGSLSLDCEADERRVRVHVRDTGTGIRPERLPAIFEPFVQGERALNRPDEGVGLGLAISRDLARGMGGELTAASEPGQGSTFTLELPRSGAADEGEAAFAAAEGAGHAEPPTD